MDFDQTVTNEQKILINAYTTRAYMQQYRYAQSNYREKNVTKQNKKIREHIYM